MIGHQCPGENAGVGLGGKPAQTGYKILTVFFMPSQLRTFPTSPLLLLRHAPVKVSACIRVCLPALPAQPIQPAQLNVYPACPMESLYPIPSG